VGSGNFALQVINSAGSALKPLGFRAEDIRFAVGSSEAARLDASGNLLVGTTNTAPSGNNVEGVAIGAGGYIQASYDGFAPMSLNRKTSDGDIAVFQKNGSTVGSIGNSGGAMYISAAATGGLKWTYLNGTNALTQPCNTTGTTTDGTHDFGTSGARFRDLYLSGGVYLGGTVAANKLDDYEYGDYQVTFTPSGGGSITVASSHNDLKYTKIGSRVFISGKVDISAASSPLGYISVTLPFVIHNGGTVNDGRRFSGSIWVGGAAIETYKFQLYGIEAESFVRIYNGSGTSLASTSADQFSGDESVAFDFHYETTP
jgi:hypothetical protein